MSLFKLLSKYESDKWLDYEFNYKTCDTLSFFEEICDNKCTLRLYIKFKGNDKYDSMKICIYNGINHYFTMIFKDGNIISDYNNIVKKLYDNELVFTEISSIELLAKRLIGNFH